MLAEKGLEAHIIQNLYVVNGFDENHFDQFNCADFVDEEMLFKFLEETQPNEIAKLN